MTNRHNRPLTPAQRTALVAITRGQVTRHPPPKPGRSRTIQHPHTIGRQVIHTLIRAGYAKWVPTGDPDLDIARPTPEGHEQLRQPVTAPPRLLRPTGSGSVRSPRPHAHGDDHDQDHDHGYTTTYDALDAGEAVDPATQRKLTDQARQRDLTRHRALADRAAERRELMEDDRRIIELQQAARRRHINISSELALIHMMLRAGRRNSALRRLQTTERHIDQTAPTG